MIGLSGGICLAQPATPAYRIKPSDVVVPQDVPIGQYRRIFRPFENWTLVCDENLKAKQSVCNVSQSVTDVGGSVVFSWSLAAAENGQPFFILRTVPDSDTATGIELKVGDVPTSLKVGYDGCNPTVCLGKTLVSPVLSRAIEQRADVTVVYRLRSGSIREMRLPFKGLNEAVISIGDNTSTSARNASATRNAPAAKDGAKPGAAPAVKEKGKPAASPGAGATDKPSAVKDNR